jgi:hypothetical protein
VSRADEPRLLAARSERGYTSRVAEALPSEPEAVGELEQQTQTLAARRRWAAEQRRAWGTARQHIFGAVEVFKRDGHPDARLLADVRALEPQVQRVDRRIGL